MRPTPAIAIVVSVAAEYSDPLLSPPPPSSAPPCEPHSSCKLRQTPYKISKDFEANAVVILIILLCALICALALNAAIRCSLRYNSRRPPSSEAKPSMAEISYVEPPTLVFVPGMNLEAAAGAAECAICLSEYLEGERIRVLDLCKHVFHVHCIQQWLFSHSSCPTCRAEASCNATAATAAANSATEYS